MNIAVILAGGNGTRLGSETPKQFLKVAGKKVIEHTIDVFEKNELIDEIAIVCAPESFPILEQMIVDNHYKKVRKILNGGKERYQSSLSAIMAYENDNDNLIFHDAVRPLVNNRIIDDCIKALTFYDAVDVAIPTTDTIIQVNETEKITYIPNRAKLRNGQTPQCFKRKIINLAYELALNDPEFVTTDDCGVIHKYLPDVPIYVVSGENFNMKLTYKEDLFLLDKLFQLKSVDSEINKLTIESNLKLPNKIMVVFGGSYGIGQDIVEIGRELGAVVYSFSRSQNNLDISNELAIKDALNSIWIKNGRIDYVVCTAGILVKESLFSISYKDIHTSISVNYIGAVNIAKEAYPFLKETQGSLLFFTSSSYTKGRMLYSIYSSTKAAIVNLVQALSEEWQDFNIKVNCINPERTKTPMRIKNFGIELESTLLSSKSVAIASINTLTSNMTGEIIDVKIKM